MKLKNLNTNFTTDRNFEVKKNIVYIHLVIFN